MPIMRIIFCLFFLLTSIDSYSQSTEFYKRFNTLRFSDQLPEGILSSKTVVLLKTPPKSTNPYIRGDWKSLSKEVQSGFVKARIDAVTHYYIDDIFSGPEPYHTFLDAFDNRNLSHAAIVEFDGSEYSIILLKLQDRDYLIKEGQDAWRSNGKDLNKIMNSLYRQAANSGLESTNLLIIETPEYGQIIDVIEGKRSEFYDLNLKSGTLAVPLMLDTAEMADVLKEYPFKWSFTDPETDDDQLRTSGFQHILYYVKSTGESAKKMLEYPISDEETAFISEIIVDGKSQVTSQNREAIVYKFYIKNVRRRNTYIGKRWDAGYSWQEGLNRYIANLKNELIQ